MDDLGGDLGLLRALMGAIGVPDASPSPLGVGEGLQFRKGDLITNFGPP